MRLYKSYKKELKNYSLEMKNSIHYSKMQQIQIKNFLPRIKDIEYPQRWQRNYKNKKWRVRNVVISKCN